MGKKKKKISVFHLCSCPSIYKTMSVLFYNSPCFCYNLMQILDTLFFWGKVIFLCETGLYVAKVGLRMTFFRQTWSPTVACSASVSPVQGRRHVHAQFYVVLGMEPWAFTKLHPQNYVLFLLCVWMCVQTYCVTHIEAENSLWDCFSPSILWVPGIVPWWPSC